MEVESLMKAIRDALNRSDIGQLHYGFQNPASPKGTSLPKADIPRVKDAVDGTSGQVFYTFDHFALLVFNTELLENPQKSDHGSVTPSVIHTDSLARVTKVEVLPVSTLHSDMAKGIYKIRVFRPEGSRMYGVCACLNLLLFSQCPMKWLLKAERFEKLLLKFDVGHVRSGQQQELFWETATFMVPSRSQQ
jgi:hypothetical protein